MRRLLRVAVLAPLLTTLFTAGGLASNAAVPGRPTCVDAAWTHHAALVVEHSDGRVIRVCIGFDSETISGEQLLASSGVEAATAGTAAFGREVCQVDGEPATYPNTCWTTTSPYWVVFVSRAGGTWTASNLGVSSQVFANGDAEGFRYDPQSGPDPPPPSPQGTCALTAAPTAPAQRSASATATASQTRSTAGGVASPAPVATTAPPSSTPGVASASAPSPMATGLTKPTPRSGLSLGALLAAGGGGGLFGLLLLSGWRARRR
jgi:hypothetical protein